MKKDSHAYLMRKPAKILGPDLPRWNRRCSTSNQF